MTKEMIRCLFDNFDVRENKPAGFLMLGQSAVLRLEDAGLVRHATKKETEGRHSYGGAYYFVLTAAGMMMYRTLRDADLVVEVVRDMGELRSQRAERRRHTIAFGRKTLGRRQRARR